MVHVSLIIYDFHLFQIILAPMSLDAATVAQVVALINDGRNLRYVANFLNVPRTTVQCVTLFFYC